MNKLTIGITSFNKEKYILDCLNSLPENVNVIIVDDKSTDNVVNVITKNFNYGVIHLNENRGVSFCRNVIIDNCETEYLLFLDGDDIICHPHISRAISSFDENIYMFPYYINFINSNKIVKYNSKNNDIKNINRTIASCIFKTEFIRNNNLRFDLTLKNLECFDFILKCIQVCKPTYIDGDCLYMYRKYPDGKRLKNSYNLKNKIRYKYLHECHSKKNTENY